MQSDSTRARRPRIQSADASLRPTRAEVHLDAIGHNLRVVRDAARGRKVLAVVKADAYGHGVRQVVPALAPLVVCRVFGTPLATAKFTAHEKGGFYGLETTPRRIMSDALRPRTPVPGLYLTGQDVLTPGIAGSLFSGMLTAAAIDPRVYTKMG